MLYFACCFSVLYTLQRCCGKMKVRETNQNKLQVQLLLAYQNGFESIRHTPYRRKNKYICESVQWLWMETINNN